MSALVEALRDDGPLRLALLLWSGVFLLLLAARLGRRTRLGWSLAAAMLALGLTYVYAALRRVWGDLDGSTPVMLCVRAATALSVTWALVEVWRADRGRRE